MLSVLEGMTRSAAVNLYGLDPALSDVEYEAFAERWRPFRTWVSVMMRAVGSRAPTG